VKAVCGESCKHGLMGAEFPQGGLATLLKELDEVVPEGSSQPTDEDSSEK